MVMLDKCPRYAGYKRFTFVPRKANSFLKNATRLKMAYEVRRSAKSKRPI